MADIVTNQIQWPRVPDGIDPKLKRYLEEMQAAVSDHLRGSLNISGDVVVGGYLVLLGPDRIKTFLSGD